MPYGQLQGGNALDPITMFGFEIPVRGYQERFYRPFIAGFAELN